MLFALFLFITMIFFITIKKHKKYNYNTKKDHIYLFENGKEIDSFLDIDLMDYKDRTTILELDIRSKFLAFFIQPIVIINNKKFYLEHSAKGKRYLDITYFAGEKISIKFIRSDADSAKIYSFDSIDIKNKNILILAPHADDAEIAAFGLYKDAQKTSIVTICTGETHHRDYHLSDSSALMKAKLRAHDAITVANIAGVPFDRCVNLGYFNNSLEYMNKNRDKLAESKVASFGDMLQFRKTEHASFATNKNPMPNHDSFISDLMTIIRDIKPDLIVTPHPQIDSHSDHKFTTFALLEAIEKLDQNPPLFTYTNHLNYNDFYPYGAMNSLSILAPTIDNKFEFDFVYSHINLDEADKFFALEAMHDLRNMRINYSIKKAFGFALKQTVDLINERDRGYFKRAVRSNEIFYVTTCKKLSNSLKNHLR